MSLLTPLATGAPRGWDHACWTSCSPTICAQSVSRAAAALAEHFHYPHGGAMLEHYRQNIAAAIVGPYKLVVQREGLVGYDLDRDDASRRSSVSMRFPPATRPRR